MAAGARSDACTGSPRHERGVSLRGIDASVSVQVVCGGSRRGSALTERATRVRERATGSGKGTGCTADADGGGKNVPPRSRPIPGASGCAWRLQRARGGCPAPHPRARSQCDAGRQIFTRRICQIYPSVNTLLPQHGERVSRAMPPNLGRIFCVNAGSLFLKLIVGRPSPRKLLSEREQEGDKMFPPGLPGTVDHEKRPGRLSCISLRFFGHRVVRVFRREDGAVRR